MKQMNIQIGNIDVPIIIDEGEEWFPVSFLCEKVLLRKGNIKFNNKYTKVYKIDYGFSTGGIQEVKCVSVDGVKEYTQTVRKGRMNVDQRKSFNELMSYLQIDFNISEDEQFIRNPSIDIKNKLSEYELDVYNKIKPDLENDYWQKCSKCDTYYPFHINFFRENQSSPNKLNTFCRSCGWTGNRSKDNIKHPDKELESVYQKYGLDIYLAYKAHETIKIYEHFIENGIWNFPKCISNKNDYSIILTNLHNYRLIDKNELCFSYLISTHRLLNIRDYFSVHEIYKLLYGDDYYLKIWEYPNATLSQFNITIEMAIQILKSYMETNKIHIKNELTYKYEDLLKDSRIISFVNQDTLNFLVQFYEYKYAGYQFKTKSNNYYKKEDNLLFDLKYLIEKDMKLNIDKIPLYLTKYNLQKKCRPLYHYIIPKKNGSLFHWVNKLYPDRFCVQDFEINPYRNEFDSDTEAYIHEILVKEFGGNVIYNQRNNNDTVKLKGKIPDWFLFTDKGVWVIEYFGMIDERHTDNNRIRDYKKKTQNKLNLYETLNGYNFLYLYKEDIEDDYNGIRHKLAEIKKTLDT